MHPYSKSQLLHFSADIIKNINFITMKAFKNKFIEVILSVFDLKLQIYFYLVMLLLVLCVLTFLLLKR